MTRIPLKCESCEAETKDRVNHHGFLICPGCKEKGEKIARAQREAEEWKLEQKGKK